MTDFVSGFDNVMILKWILEILFGHKELLSFNRYFLSTDKTVGFETLTLTGEILEVH